MVLKWAKLAKEAISVFPKPVTEHYPYKIMKEAPPGFRGKIQYSLEKCIGCGMCWMNCPAKAIEPVPTEKTRTKKKPKFYIYRCIFCGFCAEVCPTKAITLTQDYHTATLRKEDLVIE